MKKLKQYLATNLTNFIAAMPQRKKILFVLFVQFVSLFLLCGASFGIRRGMVGHWMYHGSVAASGTWYDISGQNYNVVLNGDASVDNAGLQLDGTGDYAQHSTADIFSGQTSGTIIVWAKTSSPSTEQAIFCYSNNSGTDTEIRFGIYNSQIIMQASEPAASYNDAVVSTSFTLTTGWHFYAVTSNGSTYNLYLDGVKETSLSTLVGSNSGRWFGDINHSAYDLYAQIGTLVQSSTATRLWNGSIDDVRVYNRALSAEEIQQLYHSTKGRH